MTNQGPQKPVSKKHLARAEREAKLRRNILIGTGIVLALVVGFILFGIILENVVRPRQPIATVNDTTILTGQFQKRVRYQRRQLVDQYANTVLSLQQFGTDPNLLSFMSDSLTQIDTQLDNAAFLGQDILDQLIDEELMREEAEKLGISVSEAEVDQAMEEAFGFFPDGQPTSTATPVPGATSTLTALQKSLVTSTPTPEDPPTATAEPTATPTQDPAATVTLTPTPFTREAFEGQLQDVLATFSEIGFGEDDLRELIVIQILREKLFEEITADTPTAEQQVWARHILVADEQSALDILERLDAGEDWTALAAELSTDESNKERGGDLGWFGSGAMVAEFDAAAFALDVGEISQPVQTQFGWHIIQSLGNEERELSAAELNQKRQIAFQEWLDGIRGGSAIAKVEGWESRVPTEPSVPVQLRLTAQQIFSAAQQAAQPTPTVGAATPAPE